MMTLNRIATEDGLPFHRGVAIGGALAIFFSANAVLALIYGFASVAGSPIFTGAFLVASESAIFLLCFRRVTLVPGDYVFAALLACIVVSSVINGIANTKEAMLLIVSLAAYPVCRVIDPGQIRKLAPSFTMLSGAITIIGAIVTVLAIMDQWPISRGKPVLFGSDVAMTHFSFTLGLCLLAAVTLPLTARRTAIVSALLFIPVVILAAAMVRFTFVAVLGALCVAAILSSGRQRLYVVVVMLSTLVGIAVGLATRLDTATRFMAFAVEEIQPYELPNEPQAARAPEIAPPSCHLYVNMKNSIAMRKAFLLDALYLIPRAGLFGLGLDGFMKRTCVGGQAHNSILQAAVEFGWLGGAALVLLIIISFATILPAARRHDDVRFIFCALVFVVAVSMAHGRTSRDMLLFATLGVAAAVFENQRARGSATYHPPSSAAELTGHK